jgi:AraC-like DNA-binding protein
MKNDSSPEWWPDRKLQLRYTQNIVVCGQKLYPPVDSHLVHFPRLEFPLRGCYENKIESDGKEITVKLRPGSALFAAPNCWNLPIWHPGLELMSLLFGHKQIGISIVSVRSRHDSRLAARKFSIVRPEIGPMPHILQAMTELQAKNESSPIFQDLTRALLGCMNDLLREPANPNVSRAKNLFESVCVYLQGHHDYEITRDSVAREFGISPNHLSRLFQTQGQMTFSSYLIHVRVFRAKHLLHNYELKLDDIAERCGYPNTGYFCLVFKQATKLTPSEYRAKVRGSK